MAAHWRGNSHGAETSRQPPAPPQSGHRGGNNVRRLAASGIRPVTTGASGACLHGSCRATTTLSPADRSWEARSRFVAHAVSHPDRPKMLSPALSLPRQLELQEHHAVAEGTRMLADVECAVCCMAMHPEKELVVALPCGGDHCYHWRCLKPWFSKASFCPTCRGALKFRTRTAGGRQQSPCRTARASSPMRGAAAVTSARPASAARPGQETLSAGEKRCSGNESSGPQPRVSKLSFGSGGPSASFGSPSPRLVTLRDIPASSSGNTFSLSGQVVPRAASSCGRSRAQRDYDVENYARPDTARADD
ncbi:hypothetical protein AB1Y20_012071 [Prymnesium parvum]|uniref:RING-type domain-containing protein n=1 Tax=Prymnesium parvum TaxID=97485 RepID=A0AB34IQ65_PRYPA